MTSILAKDVVLKSELKKRIANLKPSASSNLTNAYLNGLTIQQLRDLYLIAQTMRIKKKD